MVTVRRFWIFSGATFLLPTIMLNVLVVHWLASGTSLGFHRDCVALLKELFVLYKTEKSTKKRIVS